MKTIYLSGPIKGLKNENRETFSHAKAYYEALGYNVIDPHDIVDSFLLVNKELNRSKPLEVDLTVEKIKALSECQTCVLLPNWQNSKDAQYEVAFASDYGITILEAYKEGNINIKGHFQYKKQDKNSEFIIHPGNLTLDKKLVIGVTYELKIEDILTVSKNTTLDETMLIIKTYAESLINSQNIKEIKREELIAQFKSFTKKLQNGR